MAYDVMIASAAADKAKADLIARRLRALKFSVRQASRRDEATPTARDLADTNKSRTVLVLWSKAATSGPDAHWVQAIASLARSRPDALVQASIDTSAAPGAPFSDDERFKLVGLGPKRTPAGFYALVDTLGERHGRSDLADWLRLPKTDKDARDAWLKAHPKDPLAAAGKAKAKSTAASKTAAKPAAGRGARKAETAKPKAAAPADKPKTSPAGQAAAGVAGASAAETAARPPVTTPPAETPKAPVPTQFAYRRPHPATLHDEGDELDIGWTMIGPILAGIALMLLLGWVFRVQQGPASGMPAIANAQPVYAQTCPPGQIPRSLIETDVLRTGPIVDDTEEDMADPAGPAGETEAPQP